MERIYNNNKKKKIDNLFICQKQIEKLRQTVLLLIDYPCDYPVKKQYTKSSTNHLRRSDRPHQCVQGKDKNTLLSSKIKQSPLKQKSQSSKQKCKCRKQTQSQRILASRGLKQKLPRSLSNKSPGKNSNKKQDGSQSVNSNRVLSASAYKGQSQLLKKSPIATKNGKIYQIKRPIKSINTETTAGFSQTNPHTPQSLIDNLFINSQNVAYSWMSREQTPNQRQFLPERFLQKNEQFERKPQIKICQNLQSQLEVQQSSMSTVKQKDKYTSPLDTSPLDTFPCSTSPFSSRYCSTKTPKKQTFHKIQNQNKMLQPTFQSQNSKLLNPKLDVEQTNYLSNKLVYFQRQKGYSNKFQEFQRKITNYKDKQGYWNKKNHKEDISQFQRIKVLQQICKKTQNFLCGQIAPYKQFLGQRQKSKFQFKQNGSKPQQFKPANSDFSSPNQKVYMKNHNKVDLWMNQD